ncbi:hypothetical protein BJX63DRAFT_379734 [Aspergillus granulosus]|uniref:Uncharacterized protein n=1 Tax=Aspergillus granulosus TaxID=176169 RepID=A0ABR4HYP1_9EURO
MPMCPSQILTYRAVLLESLGRPILGSLQELHVSPEVPIFDRRLIDSPGHERQTRTSIAWHLMEHGLFFSCLACVRFSKVRQEARKQGWSCWC